MIGSSHFFREGGNESFVRSNENEDEGKRNRPFKFSFVPDFRNEEGNKVEILLNEREQEKMFRVKICFCVSATTEIGWLKEIQGGC